MNSQKEEQYYSEIIDYANSIAIIPNSVSNIEYSSVEDLLTRILDYIPETKWQKLVSKVEKIIGRKHNLSMKSRRFRNIKESKFTSFSDLAALKTKDKPNQEKKYGNKKILASFENGSNTLTILSDRTILKNGKIIKKIPDSMNINDFISTIKQSGFTKIMESKTMKITKSQLKQLIKEEIKGMIHPELGDGCPHCGHQSIWKNGKEYCRESDKLVSKCDGKKLKK